MEKQTPPRSIRRTEDLEYFIPLAKKLTPELKNVKNYFGKLVLIVFRFYVENKGKKNEQQS